MQLADWLQATTALQRMAKVELTSTLRVPAQGTPPSAGGLTLPTKGGGQEWPREIRQGEKAGNTAGH